MNEEFVMLYGQRGMQVVIERRKNEWRSMYALVRPCYRVHGHVGVKNVAWYRWAYYYDCAAIECVAVGYIWGTYGDNVDSC